MRNEPEATMSDLLKFLKFVWNFAVLVALASLAWFVFVLGFYGLKLSQSHWMATVGYLVAVVIVSLIALGFCWALVLHLLNHFKERVDEKQSNNDP